MTSADTPHTTDKPAPAIGPPKIWQANDLLLGQKEVAIQHGGEVYRLRLTRNGKLILQK